MKPSKLHEQHGLVKAHSEAGPSRTSSSRLTRAQSHMLPSRSVRRAAVRASYSISKSLRKASCAAKGAQGMVATMLLFLVYICFFQTEPVEQEPRGLQMPTMEEFGSVTRRRIEAIREALREESERILPKPSMSPKVRRKRVRAGRKNRGKLLRFLSVHAVGNMQKVKIGTFTNASQIGIHRFSVLDAGVNRFEVPWLLLDRVETKSFEESGYRVLYSPMKVKSSDGIGHGMTVLNAELSTAMSLGISYTHRVGIYGSISMENAYAVENIFGWGVGEVPRKFLENEVCSVGLMSYHTTAKDDQKCPVCTSVRKNSTISFKRITEIPDSLLYGCVSCHQRQLAIASFMRKHAANHTLFQMSSSKCDSSPKAADFTLTYRYLYWKYWDLHGNKRFGTLPATSKIIQGRMWSIPTQRRGRVRLAENELNIAIHVRRGDFFFAKKRQMISSKVFAATVHNAMDAVRQVDGVFAHMPVAVILYSEGRLENAMGANGHDLSKMDHIYVDTDGEPRDANWFHRLLVPGEDIIRGNETHSPREEVKQFPSGIRVEFRIATPVNESIHEMASSDIFIGSPSDFSQYAVKAISRSGLQLLSEYSGAFGACCTIRFNINDGSVRSRRKMLDFWRLYAIANEASAVRALRESI